MHVGHLSRWYFVEKMFVHGLDPRSEKGSGHAKQFVSGIRRLFPVHPHG